MTHLTILFLFLFFGEMCNKLCFNLDNGISRKLVYICYQPISKKIPWHGTGKDFHSFFQSISVVHIIELFTIHLFTTYIHCRITVKLDELTKHLLLLDNENHLGTVKKMENWFLVKSCSAIEWAVKTCTHLLSGKLLLLSNLTASAYGVCLNLLDTI